jgi:hypothetical protein
MLVYNKAAVPSRIFVKKFALSGVWLLMFFTCLFLYYYLIRLVFLISIPCCRCYFFSGDL